MYGVEYFSMKTEIYRIENSFLIINASVVECFSMKTVILRIPNPFLIINALVSSVFPLEQKFYGYRINF